MPALSTSFKYLIVCIVVTFFVRGVKMPVCYRFPMIRTTLVALSLFAASAPLSRADTNSTAAGAGAGKGSELVCICSVRS
jgi:uncharacterized membrane protein